MSQLEIAGSPSDATPNRQSTDTPTHAFYPPRVPLGDKGLLREPWEDRSAAAESQSGSPAVVARKRRRIARACDDCRRKKMKCDGGRPCASCADFNSECTYNEPVIRARGMKHRDVEDLERRLYRAETLLRKFMPEVDLESLSPTAVPDSPTTSADPRAGANVQDKIELPETLPGATATSPTETTSDDARFIPLVERIGQLDLTDNDEYVFHGLSSGAAFLGRITQQFPALFMSDSRTPFLPPPYRPFLASPIGGLPVYSSNPWWQANYDFSSLPPRDLARGLCGYCFSRASCLQKVVHGPSFWKVFEKLYEVRPPKYTREEQRFVGLLFSVIALGSMYDVDENDPTNPDHYAVAMDRGNKYYISARLYLQDITECCDMTTLQALVFSAQFLQATGDLSGCHTLIGVALRSALRMGLHRHLPNTPVNPIKDETRRRVFHAIRQMDIYLSTTLGLPVLLQDKDIDQLWPTEVDDEYITEDAILRPPPGTASFLEAFNLYTRLMHILTKVVDHLYPPLKRTDSGPADVTYMISCDRIKEIEQNLQDWHESLPAAWRPGPEEDTQKTRIKILLRFAYSHVQLMLYRPFLQFRSHSTSGHEIFDRRYAAFAAAGINVCRNIIRIGLEIQRQAVLIGPYWFITYTQFLAVLSLILYILHDPKKPEASELFADAKLGKDCISGLTQRSQAADRITAALNAIDVEQSLFGQLPNHLKSTENRIVGANIGLVRNSQHAQPRPSVSEIPQPPSRSRSFGPREQWASYPPATLENPLSRGSVATSLHRAPAPMLPISRSTHGHGPVPVTDFPIEDPFAYPLQPGVSLTADNFTTLQGGTMRLPLYNVYSNMEEQLMYFQESQQRSPLAEMPFEGSVPHFVHDDAARSQVPFQHSLLWESPDTYGFH